MLFRSPCPAAPLPRRRPYAAIPAIKAAAAKEHFQKLFQKLTELLRTGLAGSIAMGYEPAEDPDMQILELRRSLF